MLVFRAYALPLPRRAVAWDWIEAAHEVQTPSLFGFAHSITVTNTSRSKSNRVTICNQRILMGLLRIKSSAQNVPLPAM